MGQLAAIDEEGNLEWDCTFRPHPSALPCGQHNSAHISHPQVEHPGYDEMEILQEQETVDEQGRTQLYTVARKTGRRVLATDTVALPPCPACGARPFLKVAFSNLELAASNMVNPDGTPTPSRAVAERHMQLARMMQAVGKAVTGGAP